MSEYSVKSVATKPYQDQRYVHASIRFAPPKPRLVIRFVSLLAQLAVLEANVGRHDQHAMSSFSAFETLLLTIAVSLTLLLLLPVLALLVCANGACWRFL